MMTKTAQEQHPLQFAFTEDGFVPYGDAELLSVDDRELLSRFELDSFSALYRLGLQGRPEGAGASAAFLALLGATFYKRLTDLPDIVNR